MLPRIKGRGAISIDRTLGFWGPQGFLGVTQPDQALPCCEWLGDTNRPAMRVRPLSAQPSQAICPLCTPGSRHPVCLGINCQCISRDWYGFSISCACLQKDWRLNSRCLGQHKGSDDGYCLGNGLLWRWVGGRTLVRESLINDC